MWASNEDFSGHAQERSLARFVSGGVELIDNDKFFHCGEYVSLMGNSLVFVGVPYIATVSRDPRHWGWLIHFNNMTPPCVMKSRELCSSTALDEGDETDICEMLKSPLAALPRYGLYPRGDQGELI